MANPSCPLCNGHTDLQARESHANLYRCRKCGHTFYDDYKRQS